ncbi:MAG: hypothetical protein Q7O66_19770 [Dehalococcoidia bacterium]|nr:hypothetical protein [Dehalococcoidia bacterium]
MSEDQTVERELLGNVWFDRAADREALAAVEIERLKAESADWQARFEATAKSLEAAMKDYYEAQGRVTELRTATESLTDWCERKLEYGKNSYIWELTDAIRQALANTEAAEQPEEALIFKRPEHGPIVPGVVIARKTRPPMIIDVTTDTDDGRWFQHCTLCGADDEGGKYTDEEERGPHAFPHKAGCAALEALK